MYTILQPTCFMEVWLSPALGFDPANAMARIYGGGNNKISWISFQDVAQFAVAVLGSSRAQNVVIKLGGPDALSPLEVVRLAEEVLAKEVAVQHVPEEALRGQLEAAADSLQKSFAGLMLYYAKGDAIDMSETVRTFQVRKLKSVKDHLRAAPPG
jgi:NADH dehydrogenase